MTESPGNFQLRGFVTTESRTVVAASLGPRTVRRAHGGPAWQRSSASIGAPLAAALLDFRSSRQSTRTDNLGRMDERPVDRR